MKRYIVTEEAMLNRDRAAMAIGAATSPGTKESFMQGSMSLEEARGATHEVEVPDWANHWSEVTTDGDGDMQHWFVFNKTEEIPKCST